MMGHLISNRGRVASHIWTLISGCELAGLAGEQTGIPPSHVRAARHHDIEAVHLPGLPLNSN